MGARTMTALVPKADLVGVLDAFYSPIPEIDRWGADAIEAFRSIFVGAESGGIWVADVAPDCRSARTIYVRKPAGHDDAYDERTVFEFGPEAVRAFVFPREIVTSHTRVSPEFDADVRDRVASVRKNLGVTEILGLVAHPEPNVVAVVYLTFRRPLDETPRERRRLTQLGLHLESALRMRLRPKSVLAVLTPRGRVLDGDPRGQELARLRASTEHVERGRSTREIDLWTALVHGEVSVVSRSVNGSRAYIVIENARHSWSMRAFTAREQEVVRMSARGMPSKLCAYALGISESLVSVALANAAVKVGVATRLELVRLAALLARDPRSALDDATLTAAEEEILDLVALGMSNAEIATKRGRSIRTIANQIAALLRKTSSPSRRALVTQARV